MVSFIFVRQVTKTISCKIQQVQILELVEEFPGDQRQQSQEGRKYGGRWWYIGMVDFVVHEWNMCMYGVEMFIPPIKMIF